MIPRKDQAKQLEVRQVWACNREPLKVSSQGLGQSSRRAGLSQSYCSRVGSEQGPSMMNLLSHCRGAMILKAS